MLIRPARPGDEDGIAQLHVHSWQSTYRGIIPDGVLHDLSIEDRRQMWADAMQEMQSAPTKKVILVAIEDDEIVGFVCGGVARTEHLTHKDRFDCELYAIYVEKAHHSRGIGAELFAQMKDWLIKHNYKNMFLWAFADNPFLYFYEKVGGTVGDEHYINDSLGIPLKIINYAWHDMDRK